jgi:hypothetical protein
MNSTKNIVWARSSCGKVRKNTSSFRQEPMADVAERGWKRRFDEPITLPRGRRLVTLQDAGTYITKLPKAEHGAPEWQAAMEALILVAETDGPTMFARIGVMQALNRGYVRQFNPKEKEPHWGRRKLKRDEYARHDSRIAAGGFWGRKALLTPAGARNEP